MKGWKRFVPAGLTVLAGVLLLALASALTSGQRGWALPFWAWLTLVELTAGFGAGQGLSRPPGRRAALTAVISGAVFFSLALLLLPGPWPGGLWALAGLLTGSGALGVYLGAGWELEKAAEKAADA